MTCGVVHGQSCLVEWGVSRAFLATRALPDYFDIFGVPRTVRAD